MTTELSTERVHLLCCQIRPLWLNTSVRNSVQGKHLAVIADTSAYTIVLYAYSPN